MTKVLPFLNDPGIQRQWVDNEDGTFTVKETQNCDNILELNKAMATHNDGYSPSREMRRVASIPLALVQKWLVEEGWNAFDKQCAHKLAEKLDSSEYAYLRTAPGRLGIKKRMV